MKRRIMFACLIPMVALCIRCQSGTVSGGEAIPAAEQGDEYLPLLEGKRVALVVNHTATAGGKHLLDFLLENGIRVVAIFAPEHGFRGEAADGEIIAWDPDIPADLQKLFFEAQAPAEGALVLVGASALTRSWGIDAGTLKSEGFRIKTAPRGVAIVGEVAPPDSFFRTSPSFPRTSFLSSNRFLRSSISRRRLARVSNQNRVASCALSPELFR